MIILTWIIKTSVIFGCIFPHFDPFKLKKWLEITKSVDILLKALNEAYQMEKSHQNLMKNKIFQFTTKFGKITLFSQFDTFYLENGKR